MNRYIPANKLIAEIERRKEKYDPDYTNAGSELKELLSFIAHIQQEQRVGEEYAIEVGKHTHTLRVGSQSDIDNLIRQEKQEQPELSNNLVDIDAVREDFMTEVYRVLDADSTNDRANAIINAFDSLPTISREQPKVDLEEEVRKYCGSSFRFNYDELNDSFYSNTFEFDDVVELARHFYELGLNARKEE